MNLNSPMSQSGDELYKDGESNQEQNTNSINSSAVAVEFCLDYVELVDDVLVVSGWIVDTEDPMVEIKLLPSADNKVTIQEPVVISTLSERREVRFQRVSRWDVSKQKSIDISSHSHKHGFVFASRASSADNTLCATFSSGKRQEIALERLSGQSRLYQILEHSGYEIYSASQAFLGDDHSYVKSVMAMSNAASTFSSTKQGVDKCFNVGGEFLFVSGWIAEEAENIKKVSIRDENGMVDNESSLFRHRRSDLSGVFPEFGSSPLGYCFAVPLKWVLGKVVTLEIELESGYIVSAKLDAEYSDWLNFINYVDRYTGLYPPIMSALAACCQRGAIVESTALRIEAYRETRFRRYAESLPLHLENEGRLVAAVDSVQVIKNAGIYLTGWYIQLQEPIVDIKVCLSSGEEYSVKENMFLLPRPDLAAAYGEKYGEISLRCGFAVYVEIPSFNEGVSVLRYVTASGHETDLQLKSYGSNLKGVRYIEELIKSVPNMNLLTSELYSLFDSGLGKAIETVNNNDKCTNLEVITHDFGTAPKSAEVSVIIPLYGRYDFVRYQLAEFANDEYMRKQDIVFVVDDPRISSEVNSLASRYFQLFKVPFRVVQYERNLGYAGANNVGVSVARSELVLLMNSDVIPSKKNWLKELVFSYRKIPRVGVIGPLLKFYDDSIQHAGMYPKRNRALPGYILNYHKNMGMSSDVDAGIEAHPMITGACMLLSKKLYNEVGGFDESYVIGDFEDSDLCLSIRKMGYEVFIDAGIELWHLERQSQNINKNMSVRQLITMYNGWRYTKKIQMGTIANPEDIVLSSAGVQ